MAYLSETSKNLCQYFMYGACAENKIPMVSGTFITPTVYS